ncbi:hypothetical protein QVD17_06592 [Tagetes erecta]|uniref:Uncharacterized protein n=1 Tax=Tagetes erecta TaxID=13708 RepID=A0AAD8PCC3_TARER|nr:hypothetical protein QVD17_06592 [Tagetes erecta]
MKLLDFMMLERKRTVEEDDDNGHEILNMGCGDSYDGGYGHRFLAGRERWSGEVGDLVVVSIVNGGRWF